MSTTKFEDHDFVNGLARELVVKFAPEEIDMFDDLAKEFYKAPTAPNVDDQSNDPLGFGLNEMLLAITPVALAMTNAVLNFIATSALEALKEQSSERIHTEIKKLFKAFDKEDHQLLLQFNREEIPILRRIAIQEAEKFVYIQEAER